MQYIQLDHEDVRAQQVLRNFSPNVWKYIIKGCTLLAGGILNLVSKLKWFDTSLKSTTESFWIKKDTVVSVFSASDDTVF